MLRFAGFFFVLKSRHTYNLSCEYTISRYIFVIIFVAYIRFAFRKRNFVITCLLEELFKQEPRIMSELKPVLTGTNHHLVFHTECDCYFLY